MKARASRFVWLAAVPALTVGVAPALARETAGSGKGWSFDLAPYIWAAGVEGKISTVDGDSVLDVPFGDILENLEHAGFIHFEGRDERWGFLVDASYVSIEEESDLASTASFDTTLEQTIGEAAGFHRFGGDRTSFDLLFGVRGIHLDVESEITDSPFPGLVGQEVEADRGWVDVMAGGRFNMQLSESWSMANRIDLSAGGSDLTWQVASTVLWQMSPHVALGFGIRILDVDYEDDEDSIELEPQLAGVTAGLNFRFP